MRGKNYLLIILVIVMLYLYYTKSTFSQQGDTCAKVDINGQYREDEYGKCVLQFCDDGYVIEGGLGAPSCAKIGSECPTEPANGVSVYGKGSDGINGVCNLICNPGYIKSKNPSGNDVCTWVPVGACSGTDPNGVYTYGSSKNCNLVSCKFGYMPNGNNTACIPVPPGNYSASRQI